ncbi:50S ribosomal protein L33 [Salipaludibacillus agaradhaerens]|uniref:Large ribosomal subunit protein bL33 n=1 Tax=Salipaludibacillus agaradhaerens TaxID=76935 RepID=A0A9Q4B586_SALAG|nr:50S ribosomal protein L33 [Salipaludibacillus agaradhaerens]MCR6108868.1 50S ribosomal protein L33 [Bacillus sp. A301a_S52]UJW56044.1 50S ribosomal protein L33 [Bacillus sp. A116_S68]MCR6098360.1 50S ribosomal protein L33 [Salipaludibacillus agaradhaerens]MCR6104803.1 50S ribosomal protein L33 [Salipaludibacillus agaradhaerens]MCR6116010.1 50S ribosomal protein L33 [Salipaludibacillus agaradhaerens]
MSQKVILACQHCQSRNYATSKTDQDRAERLQIKKYCKICGKHTPHFETK